MTSILKRAASVLMSAIVSVGILSAFTASLSADTKAPGEIERVIVDCRSAEAFSKTSSVHVHTPTEKEPDPYTGGKYSFVDSAKAMEVLYNGNQKNGNQFRIMTKFNVKGSVTEEYKYFVIVYAAKTEKDYKLTVWNGAKAGPEVVIAEHGENTRGKYVVSDPVDISVKDPVKNQSTLSRWTQTIHSTICFGSTDERARFFIKEYAFFKTPEDAKAYYSAVDLNKSPSEYGENTIKPGSSAAAPASPKDPNNNVADFNYIIAPDPAFAAQPSTEEKILTPVILDFSSNEALRRTAYIRQFTDPATSGLGGINSFVTLPDGTGCLKIDFSEYEGYDSFRVMPYLKTTGLLTADHKYVCVTYMTTDFIPRSLSVRNNAKANDTVVLTTNTAVSGGKFVTTAPADISGGDILGRFVKATHNTFGLDSISELTDFYIKEIGFFSSFEQAKDHYASTIKEERKIINCTELKFGLEGNIEAVRDDPTWGKSTDSDDCLIIGYADKTNFNNVHYMAKVRPLKKELTDPSQYYMRVLYSAKNPADVKNASMYFMSDAGRVTVLVDGNITDTNGEYVLSDTVCLDAKIVDRLYVKTFNSLFFNVQSKGGEYRVKSIYLFDSREDAEAFGGSDVRSEITINGNPIEKYTIIVGKDTTPNVLNRAEKMSDAIFKLSGVRVPVMTDETPVSPYEILVGESNRPVTTAYYDEILAKGPFYYKVFVENDCLVISAPYGLTTVSAAEAVNKTFFFDGVSGAPEKLDITAKNSFYSRDTVYRVADFWEEGTPVDAPEVVKVDFSSDEGYFNEANGENNWYYKNGSYVADAKDYASSYLHVYEKNVIYKARLSYSKENGGNMGIITRFNAAHAFIKAGYDFGKGEWYIESRDGKDYYLHRVASAKAKLTPNTAYDIEFTLLGNKATLSVNNKNVISDAAVDHYSPGRLGLYAENASVSFDSVEITLTSGMGTVWKNVHYTRIPGEETHQGGTFFERNDGSIQFVKHSALPYKSVDGGKSWQECEAWSDVYENGYINMIRLHNGDWLRILKVNIDGKYYMISRTSSDDGETWVDGGIVCEGKFKGNTTANANNMNDKVMQTKDGRILYCQAYESSKANGMVDGRYIFCSYFFSDDNGKTWYKSETDSFDLQGIENEPYFGENKLLECADGTIRMYASWHMLGYLTYAESTDGGKTFGPLQYMYEFPTVTSSMQFCKDEYADNDYTYYMVWLNNECKSVNTHTPRARLSLAKTTDGKNWVYLGDVMRWESTFMDGSTVINHVVNPSVYVTEDSVIIGTGFSEGRQEAGELGASYHQGQRQHIFTVKKNTLPEGKVLNRFTDVSYSDPAYDAITYVSGEGLFQGTADNAFSPKAIMNRAMFVTVLGRLAEADVSDYTAPTFADVAAGQWYTPYVEWAAANGIVNGLGNGVYGVSNEVTVQQACVILARYANYAAANNPGAAKTSTDFPDGSLVADWAAKEVEWAVANGVYTGTLGKLDAYAPATRAVVAQMFCNFAKVFSN